MKNERTANDIKRVSARVYAKRLKYPLPGGTPDQRREYESVRVLHYAYSVGALGGRACFHLLCEVGEPWQATATAKLAALLRAKPAYELRTVELGAAPWYVEALVKKNI